METGVDLVTKQANETILKASRIIKDKSQEIDNLKGIIKKMAHELSNNETHAWKQSTQTELLSSEIISLKQ